MSEQEITDDEHIVYTLPNALEYNDRITARIDVYHETYDEQPEDFHHVFSELTNQSEEEVYSRKIKVTEEWTAIDTGWISEVGCILLKNTDKKYKLLPDEDEIESEKKKIVRIRTGKTGAGWIVGKGMFFFGYPSDEETTEIKCEFETTTVELNIFPK